MLWILMNLNYGIGIEKGQSSKSTNVPIRGITLIILSMYYNKKNDDKILKKRASVENGEHNDESFKFKRLHLRGLVY